MFWVDKWERSFFPVSLIYCGDGTAFPHNSLYCNNKKIIKKEKKKRERERDTERGRGAEGRIVSQEMLLVKEFPFKIRPKLKLKIKIKGGKSDFFSARCNFSAELLVLESLSHREEQIK